MVDDDDGDWDYAEQELLTVGSRIILNLLAAHGFTPTRDLSLLEYFKMQDYNFSNCATPVLGHHPGCHIEKCRFRWIYFIASRILKHLLGKSWSWCRWYRRYASLLINNSANHQTITIDHHSLYPSPLLRAITCWNHSRRHQSNPLLLVLPIFHCVSWLGNFCACNKKSLPTISLNFFV